MGCVYNRGTRTKPNWWIKYQDPSGKTRYRRVGPDRELARRVLAKIEGDVVAGEYGLRDESAPTATLAGLLTDWAEERRKTHRAHKDTRIHVTKHLVPAFGAKPPRDVSVVDIKAFIRAKREEGLAPQTIRNVLATFSVFYNDLVDDEDRWGDVVNPVARLGRRGRKLIGPRYDPRRTDYLRGKDQIRSVYLALPELTPRSPWRAMYAAGVFAGLRTGEIRALEKADLDLGQRQIHVRRSAGGPLKDDDSRFVPILDPLLPILREWLLMSEPGALVFPHTGRGGGRPGRPPRFIREQTLWRHLREALAAASLPASMTWYQCTRHTFASHWLLDGGTLARLAEILGHSMEQVSARYGHLERRREVQASDLGKLRIDLRPGAKPVQMSYAGVTQADAGGAGGLESQAISTQAP